MKASSITTSLLGAILHNGGRGRVLTNFQPHHNRSLKRNPTNGEKAAGFAPGPRDYSVFRTPHGKVGLALCWDRHRLDILRALARNGADIMPLPVDDDFSGNPRFPFFHASDGVFRAVENHVAMGLGTTNGLSLVVDPYGRITAEGKINVRGVIVGETFVAGGQTIYTRFGDWFGWTLVVALIVLVAMATGRQAEQSAA